jgi:hypothetical protein
MERSLLPTRTMIALTSDSGREDRELQAARVGADRTRAVDP